MNRGLKPISDTPYPTTVQTLLRSGASIARFDPSGRFIAGGRPDGIAIIWDLDTKSEIRYLEGHMKAITSIDWSANSRYILSSSKDWNIIIWDLASDIDPPRRFTTIRFDGPIISATFHPRNMKIVLVLSQDGEVFVVDLRKGHRGRYELVEGIEEDSDGLRSFAMTVARFDPLGKLIFVGTSNGLILVYSTRTKALVGRHRIAGAGTIKGLGFAKSGRRLITNSYDRTLRQFNLPVYPMHAEEGDLIERELEPTLRFTDPVNRVAWHNMAYSPDGNWLAGGSADPATHKIYIWDIINEGEFATALDGGREPLLDVIWHPKAPAIASTTKSGDILLWHSPAPERWGAFAGGFEEVDENIEYDEREDEFDIEDEFEMAERKKKEEDVEVGILDDVSGESDAHRRETKDEDILWAENEPDDDRSGWKMKVLLVDDTEL